MTQASKPRQLILSFSPSHRNMNGDFKRAAISKTLAVQRLVLLNVQEEQEKPKEHLIAGDILWQSEIRRVRAERIPSRVQGRALRMQPCCCSGASSAGRVLPCWLICEQLGSARSAHLRWRWWIHCGVMWGGLGQQAGRNEAMHRSERPYVDARSSSLSLLSRSAGPARPT